MFYGDFILQLYEKDFTKLAIIFAFFQVIQFIILLAGLLYF